MHPWNPKLHLQMESLYHLDTITQWKNHIHSKVKTWSSEHTLTTSLALLTIVSDVGELTSVEDTIVVVCVSNELKVRRKSSVAEHTTSVAAHRKHFAGIDLVMAIERP